MSKVFQEFYCTKSGGGCGGYITVKLNTSINSRVTIVCPKCSHEHKRTITNGELSDKGRYDKESTEEICPTIAAWSEHPRYSDLLIHKQNERVSPIINVDDSKSKAFTNERWFEIFGGVA